MNNEIYAKVSIIIILTLSYLIWCENIWMSVTYYTSKQQLENEKMLFELTGFSEVAAYNQLHQSCAQIKRLFNI